MLDVNVAVCRVDVGRLVPVEELAPVSRLGDELAWVTGDVVLVCSFLLARLPPTPPPMAAASKVTVNRTAMSQTVRRRRPPVRFFWDSCALGPLCSRPGFGYAT